MQDKRSTILVLLITIILFLTIGCSQPGDDDTTPTAVTLVNVVQTGGTSSTVDSTSLTLTFDIDPITLTANDITVTGATKGALSGTGTTRTLAISDITVGNGATVEVSIASTNNFTISGSPKTAVVYRAATAVTFVNVVQTGGTSFTVDSTGLTLTFDIDPTTLTANDITVTGATKGALSGTGTTRTLAISDITVSNGAAVEVSIASPSNFAISGSPKTAVVYRAPIATTFESVLQTGGTSYTADSTALKLTFDIDPITLTANDITVTGATKGTLSGTGTTRTLAISDITVGDGETVSVTIANPSGYIISGSPKTAVIYRKAPYIGMAYQGGIIAYILQSGDPGYVPGENHGLIASIADLSAGIKWHRALTPVPGAAGTALGTGLSNTVAIVNVQGLGSYAAKLCYDYTNTDTGTGVYSDWYLPSKDELDKLFRNRAIIGGFPALVHYWSSTEYNYDSGRAWVQGFDFGAQGHSDKGLDYIRVRAVRAF